MAKFIWAGLAVLTMVGLFISSSIPGDESGAASLSIALWVQRIIPLSDDALNFLVRKTAHFVAYFTLGFFVAQAAKYYGKNKKITFAVAWGIASLYGVLDEIHQYFVPGRVCALSDMIINAIGAFAGVGVVYILTQIIKRKKEKAG